MPLVVAPMAYQRLVHPAGELAMARAAAAARIPLALSTMSSTPLENVAAVAPCWFQLYWLRDRGQVRALIERAEGAGCTAILVTLDVPVMARRLRDVRNGFVLPPSVTPMLLSPDAAPHTPRSGGSAVAAHTAVAFDPSLGWKDLEWLRSQTALPLALKGILDPKDAVRAVEVGADAVVVSNHGGRQFAGAVASITALPAVAEAVAGRCEVMLDGGIRSGTDVLRALACGADGVQIGRPLLWGLAIDGESGVTTLLELLRTELDEALLLSGCADLDAARSLGHYPSSAPAAAHRTINAGEKNGRGQGADRDRRKGLAVPGHQ